MKCIYTTGLLINDILVPKIVNIFLFISLYICFGCSKEPSYRNGCFEHPQRMFGLRNKKVIFILHTFIWRPGTSSRSINKIGDAVQQFKI